MTSLRRLMVVGAVLASAIVFNQALLLGEPTASNSSQRSPLSADQARAESSLDNLAEAKFSQPGVLTYQSAEGDLLFAMKLQPKIDPTSAKPQDIVVLVDSTASQAGPFFQMQRGLTRQVAKSMGADDKISIWNVNTKASELTTGLSKKDKALEAVNTLDKVTPLGAADLKTALQQAVTSLTSAPGRQAIVLYVGDGMSTLNPIRETDRTALSRQMVERKIQFFAVPIGPQLDGRTMHGLAVATGGAVVRLQLNDTPETALTSLQNSIRTPVLYTTNVTWSAGAKDVYPTQLPPLRSDVPTLVMGRLPQAAGRLECTMAGTVADRQLTLKQTEDVLPSSPDCFFLTSMERQWRDAKELPALVRADWGLRLAAEQMEVTHDEVLGHARLALAAADWQLAGKLYAQALLMNPADTEAKSGAKLADQLASNKTQAEKFLAMAQAPAGDAKAGADKDNDLLRRAQQNQMIEEQRVKLQVEETLKQSRRDLNENPDDAVRRLKLMAEAVRLNPDLKDEVRRRLSLQLENETRAAQQRADRFLVEKADRELQVASSKAKEGIIDENNKKVKNLISAMGQYTNLIEAGRLEEAMAQAAAANQLAHLDVTEAARGRAELAYDVATTAGYVKDKEVNYLATMWEVQRSSVSFPDDPPVVFPDDNNKRFYRYKLFRNWGELTLKRKTRWGDARYSETGGGEKLKEVEDIERLLKEPTDKLKTGVDKGTPLKDALDFICRIHNVRPGQSLKYRINHKAFVDAGEPNIEEKQVELPPMPRVPLATILLDLLSRIDPPEAQGSFVIKGDFIEITTVTRALAEKVHRVQDVGDLVMPPKMFSIDDVQSSGAMSGGGMGGMGGGMMGGMGGMGGGMMGGMGGMGGGMMGGGGGMMGGGGGFGGGGFGGGGMMGGGMGGMGGGMGGMGGMGGGYGGGMGGGGGGQLGQPNIDRLRYFYANQLKKLIANVVESENGWELVDDQPARGGYGGGGMMGGGMGGGGFAGGGGGLGDQQEERKQEIGENTTGNQRDTIRYYDPVFALVIKAPSSVNTRIGSSVKKAGGAGGGGGGGGGGAMKNGGDDRRFANNDKPAKGDNGQLAQKSPAKPNEVAAARNLDPKVVWNEALAEAPLPGTLVAQAAGVLGQFEKWDHAAEFLKAALRQGQVVRPWVFEALAAALEANHGDPDEVERALLSTADLQPDDAWGLLKGAEVLAAHKQYASALRLCKQSIAQSPGLPQTYLKTLDYARQAQDAATVAWAANELLSRDWPLANEMLHAEARQQLNAASAGLVTAGRRGDAEQLASLARQPAKRDLVIKVSWQGEADLDLEVTEPVGTICSFAKRQTVGGGTLLSDGAAGQRQEVYLASRAYTGTYQVRVRRVWGQPVGDKAVVEVIRGQGTPEERVERLSVSVTGDAAPTAVKLDNGRRTELADVAPISALKQLVREDKNWRQNMAYRQLSALATPVTLGIDGHILGSAGASRASQASRSSQVRGPFDPEEMDGQNNNGQIPIIQNAVSQVSLPVEVVVSPDRRYVRLTLNPIKSGVESIQTFNLFLPGGN